MDKIKQQRTVVHLELEGGRHYYFGNLKALCDNFDNPFKAPFSCQNPIMALPKTTP